MAKKLSKSAAWTQASGKMLSAAEELVGMREALSDHLDNLKETAGNNLINVWQEALTTEPVKTMLETIGAMVGTYNTARGEMEAAIEGYQDWLDNMPESLQNGATGEMVSACAECEPGDEAEFDEIFIKDDGSIEFNDNFEDLVDTAGDLNNQDLPNGFGKD
jgi:vacuolar-type H+-ATPase subunit E/Vma4